MVAIANDVLTEADLLAAAGQRSFERGLGYTDAVVGLMAVGKQITATVHGTDEYFVMLALSGGGRGRASGAFRETGERRVTGACNCPYGREGFFCKHCVAVGLAYLGSRASSEDRARSGANASATADTNLGAGPRAGAGPSAGTGSAADVGPSADTGPGATGVGDDRSAEGLIAWLNSLQRDELLLLVLEEAVDNDEWRGRLAFRAAAATTAATTAANVDAMASHLVALLDPGEFGACGYVDEGESRRYARRVDTVVEVIGDLVDAGDAVQGQDLAAMALGLVTSTCRDAADPAGVIWEAVAYLTNAHLQACQADPPDQRELAEFIAGRLMIADVPAISVTEYRELLGDAGLAGLRELLAGAVAEDPRNWAASGALEDLLRSTGDTDALVEHLSANLPATGLGHLKIAVDLAAAGRTDDALKWAEDGLRVSHHRQPNIADFLVQRYLGLGRIDEALTVRREVFAAAPDLASFQRLRDAAERATAWPDTRVWALGLLRSNAEKARSRHRGTVVSQLPAPLVDILIAEGEIDAAWDAAAGIATEAQWLRLADLLADTRPADALAVYLRQVDQLRNETGDRAYERIARLLIGARACHRGLGTETAFRSYLRSFRLTHKRKRKLIGILDAHQL
ncbi:MAG TPA: hypothetical protein VFQ44_08585 [Streptosporangiaceae bacterium]|nr:hypothetical protein [Streptosporangiaceae bacterium]